MRLSESMVIGSANWDSSEVNAWKAFWSSDETV